MSWNTFKQHYLSINELDFALDYSRIRFSNDFFQANEAKMQSAFKAMDALEAGSIANPDEGRQVGHYWLRNAELAPDSETQKAITEALETIDSIVEKVHSGSCAGESGAFKHLLIIGIGGSALGPQFVADALGGPKNDRINTFYFDNTDPDGMDRTLDRLEGQLGQTLSVVISKSGGTAETRNGMIEAKNAYTKAGLDFAKHAIAITGEGSKLDSLAVEENWLYRLPMWDWVGGRTSELATVGLLPAALQGIKIGDLLNGAKAMDGATRIKETRKNPAALLALSWYQATEGKGSKDMVILPYKDRLVLFSKYLQQLIMESLGKETDLDGTVVNQGIAVYGNKGSTDQHAYVQQLREGVNNFFVTFIEVLKDRKGASISVDEVGNSTGDYLHGFYLGTREALDEKDRETLTVTIKEVNAHSIGQLIALFERAVGLYAHLININAYHQPGVEAGKKAATNILKMKQTVCELLEKESPSPLSVDAIAEKTSLQNNEELIFKILYRLAHNSASNIQITSNTCPTEAEFYSQ
jgi:glucose-6-phosphate isomerase